MADKKKKKNTLYEMDMYKDGDKSWTDEKAAKRSSARFKSEGKQTTGKSKGKKTKGPYSEVTVKRTKYSSGDSANASDVPKAAKESRANAKGDKKSKSRAKAKSTGTQKAKKRGDSYYVWGQ